MNNPRGQAGTQSPHAVHLFRSTFSFQSGASMTRQPEKQTAVQAPQSMQAPSSKPRVWAIGIILTDFSNR
jgi:hypothetical protein